MKKELKAFIHVNSVTGIITIFRKDLNSPQHLAKRQYNPSLYSLLRLSGILANGNYSAKSDYTFFHKNQSYK